MAAAGARAASCQLGKSRGRSRGRGPTGPPSGAGNVTGRPGGVAQLVERLTGSQEVRGFESLRLHPRAGQTPEAVLSSHSKRLSWQHSGNTRSKGAAVGNIQDASARRAIDQLRTQGWAIGPRNAPDEWRRAVRAEARRAGVRMRTGVTRHRGELVPWAVASWAFDDWDRVMAHVSFEMLGAAAVRADDEVRQAEGRQPDDARA
jgi:hypothetical protein